MNLSRATELRAAALAALMLGDPNDKGGAWRALAAGRPAPDPDKGRGERGLDASPLVREKLLSVGDRDSAAVIDVILRDEIGHVAVGNAWFRWLCAERGLDTRVAAREIERRVGAPAPKGPLNLEARRAAGFDRADIDAAEADATASKPAHVGGHPR